MNSSSQSTRFALRNATLIDDERVLNRHAILIDGDQIEDVRADNECPSDIECFDLQQAFVAPGFIDLQLNGCGGVLFNDAVTAETLRAMHQTNLQSGVTGFLPTLITTTEDEMRIALETVAELYEDPHSGVLGIHLEGPYINPARKGIHNAIAIRKPSPGMFEHIVTCAGKFPVMLTLAPEMNDASQLRALAEAGVILSIGHSNARYEEAWVGFDSGIRVATHLFNAMSPWAGRDPGVVGAVLDRDEVASGIIVDGFHVHYASVRLAKRIKRQKLFLVTDAVTPVGTKMRTFRFGGQTIYVKEGRCVNAEEVLAGALLTMIEAVANCVRYVGIPLWEAVRMASLYPARILRRDHELGRVAKGYIANLAVFDENYFVKGVVERGAWLTHK
jgi:N-acetylglucosamine-6-phosphate deacetylase